MQRVSRRTLEKWARWLVMAAIVVIGAIFGQDRFTGSSSNTNPGGPLPATVRGAARAIDGDSLYVGRDEVRMKGIDAPEGRQTCTRDGREWACGDAARDELRRLIGKNVVECRADERDKHGRLLATCSAAGRNLNAAMVASGMAVSYGSYRREEAEAKAARRGLWGSEFQRPRDWRHERGIGL